MIRAALGHPPADIEATLARFQMHGSDLAQARVAAQALAQLRDQKVAELQILGLHECGRSLNKRRRDKKDFSTSHKAFNLNALLSTVDALIDQHQLLQDKASEQEEVERSSGAEEKKCAKIAENPQPKYAIDSAGRLTWSPCYHHSCMRPWLAAHAAWAGEGGTYVEGAG